jgi:hypothetical protein
MSALTITTTDKKMMEPSASTTNVDINHHSSLHKTAINIAILAKNPVH